MKLRFTLICIILQPKTVNMFSKNWRKLPWLPTKTPPDAPKKRCAKGHFCLGGSTVQASRVTRISWRETVSRSSSCGERWGFMGITWDMGLFWPPLTTMEHGTWDHLYRGLVVWTPLKNMKISWDDELPNIWRKTCSKPKPPTSYRLHMTHMTGKGPSLEERNLLDLKVCWKSWSVPPQFVWGFWFFKIFKPQVWKLSPCEYQRMAPQGMWSPRGAPPVISWLLNHSK